MKKIEIFFFKIERIDKKLKCLVPERTGHGLFRNDHSTGRRASWSPAGRYRNCTSRRVECHLAAGPRGDVQEPATSVLCSWFLDQSCCSGECPVWGGTSGNESRWLWARTGHRWHSWRSAGSRGTGGRICAETPCPEKKRYELEKPLQYKLNNECSFLCIILPSHCFQIFRFFSRFFIRHTVIFWNFNFSTFDFKIDQIFFQRRKMSKLIRFFFKEEKCQNWSDFFSQKKNLKIIQIFFHRRKIKNGSDFFSEKKNQKIDQIFFQRRKVSKLFKFFFQRK